MSMFTNISDSTYIDISSATVHKINMQKPLLVSAYNNITHQDIYVILIRNYPIRIISSHSLPETRTH